MTRRPFLPLILVLQSGLTAATVSAPALQWFKTVSGSGSSSVASVAADSHGNFYVAGNTTSLDFPTKAAAQAHAGGSPLIRINLNSGAAQKIYSAGLATASSVAADPENPQTLYATSNSGVLRSTDGGNTWKTLPGFPSHSIAYWVAVDPRNSNTLYAATTPLGVLKSADGGATWTAINHGIPVTTNQTVDAYGHLQTVTTVNVYRIWIDPKSPAVLFAQGNSGLLQSTDAGANWSVTSLGTSFFGSLSFDPFTKGTIYASGRGFYKSTDEGQTWTTLGVLPDQSSPTAITPDPFHQGTLFGGSYSGLFESTDSGQTWILRIQGQTTQIAADSKQPVVYANPLGLGIVRSTDGFQTYSPISPLSAALAQYPPQQLQLAGSFVIAVVPPSTDVFITKLDTSGNIVYSTYFGGTGADTVVGIAVGGDGSVYLTGTTGSTDLPVTKGVYASTLPLSISQTNSGTGGLVSASFVAKLNPDGSLGWSTYFSDGNSIPGAIAVDAGGSVHVGGKSSGGLPTTPGVYETQFQSVSSCGPGNIGPCPPPLTSAFLTKFNAQGSALTFSTYVSQDAKNNPIQFANAIALAPDGDIYFADSPNLLSSPAGGGVHRMNASGSALLGSNSSEVVAINSIALDAAGNLFATGRTISKFTATPGSFQTSPQPAIPSLPGSVVAGGGTDAFVVKYDSTLSKILGATLLGGEGIDYGQSVAIDPAGRVVVSGYTDSKAFPLRAPFQTSFSDRSGFVAGFDSNLSQLLFSTYLGDTRQFSAQGAVADGEGNLLLAGSTLESTGAFLSGDAGFSFTMPATVIVNKIALPAAPAVRLDSVVNYASKVAVPLSPGEAIEVIGSGFGSDAKLLLDGKPLAPVSTSANRLTAVMPNDGKTSGSVRVAISSNGASSNPVYVPAAAASPGIYSVDNTGFGQGYILNHDGTRNSKSNPAAPGSAITIFVTGVGKFTEVGPYAVLEQPVAVFIDEFYSSGIAAVVKKAAGLPGDVYEIGVYVPDPATLPQNPDLGGPYKLPPEGPVVIYVGSSASQPGIAIWVTQN